MSDDCLYLTQWILDELHEVVARKWPFRLPALDALLTSLDYSLLPSASSGVEIRDRNDQPILDSAIAGGVDVVVTGDKDFHALAVNCPLVVTPRGYLDLTALEQPARSEQD